MENDIFIWVLLRNNRLNDTLFGTRAARSFIGDDLITLDRDKNSVHTKRNHGAIFIVILNSDLSLTILSKAGVELGSKNIIPSIFTKFQVKQPTKHSTDIGVTTKTIARSNNED